MLQRFFQFKLKKELQKALIAFSAVPKNYLKEITNNYTQKESQVDVETWEKKAKEKRKKVTELLGKSKINTSDKIEKYKLFLRINYVIKRTFVFQKYLNKNSAQLKKSDHSPLAKLIVKAKEKAELLQESVEAVYQNYDEAKEKIEKIKRGCEETIRKISIFKYSEKTTKEKWEAKEGKERIGTALRELLQAIRLTGNKIAEIAEKFSY
jgi:hypothetical protein